MRASGIPVPDGKVVAAQRGGQGARAAAARMCSSPCRRARASASSSCPEDHEHPPQELNDPGWAFGEELLAERYIPGRELTCAVMGERVLGVTEIVPAEALRFYNYEAKYAEGGSLHLLPAPA